MIIIVVFLFGLAVGSFLNAFIYRMEIQKSVMRGRSFCPSCSHTLFWYDLIPLLSYTLLKGKCRYCKEKISFQYPLVELATGILFVLLLLKLGLVFSIFELSYLFAIASLLTVIFVYDLKHFIIPDKVLYPAIGFVLFWQLILHFQIVESLTKVNFIQALLAGLGAAGFFFAIYIFSKGRAMGFGDVKLALFMGLFLLWPNILVAMSIAFTAGAIVGVALILFKRKTMRSEVPFGPFLILGTFVALFWGEALAGWYLSFLGV